MRGREEGLTADGFDLEVESLHCGDLGGGWWPANGLVEEGAGILLHASWSPLREEARVLACSSSADRSMAARSDAVGWCQGRSAGGRPASKIGRRRWGAAVERERGSRCGLVEEVGVGAFGAGRGVGLDFIFKK